MARLCAVIIRNINSDRDAVSVMQSLTQIRRKNQRIIAQCLYRYNNLIRLFEYTNKKLYRTVFDLVNCSRELSASQNYSKELERTVAKQLL